ncbi:major capsid protein [Brevibacillus parabrevis]|jgi:Phage major capsid protein E.|uniref:major capsid protein n=1 Tax=Brevibacillus parabrevis TaxID=54914 RepID=UPI002490B69A|nr:major capsid protein [Brevibacillus parabrevis]
MPTIFDLINARNIATYYEENGSNKIPYLGETLFPARKQLGLDLSWIKGFNGLPVSLKPSEFDAKATLRDRVQMNKIDTEMPFFREAMRVGEKERQELLRLMSSTNSQYLMPVINRIYDDATNLVNGARVISERMIMQLLSTGKISIAANRLNYDYDYKLPAEHKETLTSTDQWSDPNSNPVDDIRTWQDKVEDDTGVRPTRAICTRKTWNYLLTNKTIRLDMNPAGGQNIILTDSMLQQYLAAKLGVSAAVYNKKFALEVGGAAQNFYPDDYFTLIPEGNLGNLYYGTTPEEADLMSGGTSAEVQVVNTGVAITTVKEPHPVNVETIVSQICLPSFETIDTIFIAKVA